jgi:hypothetical protein
MVFSHNMMRKEPYHEPGSNHFLSGNRFLAETKFRQCVNRYSGNHRIRSFTCFNQFLCMAFAQLAYRETRSKTNTGLRRVYSHKVDKTTGIRYDQTVVATGFYSKKDYPEQLRRIKYFDAEKGRSFVFLTNQFVLPALTIAE